MSPRNFGLLFQIFRDINDLLFFPEIIFPTDCFLLEKTHYPSDCCLNSYRQFHRIRVCTLAIFDRITFSLEGGTDTSQFVDKTDTRNAITISLTPNRLTLRLYTLNRIKYDNPTI